MNRQDQPADEGASVPAPDNTKILPTPRTASKGPVRAEGHFHEATPLGDGASDFPPVQPDRSAAEPVESGQLHSNAQLLDRVNIPTDKRAQYSEVRSRDVSPGGTHGLAGVPLGTPIGEGLTSQDEPKPRLRAADKPPVTASAPSVMRSEEPAEYFAPPKGPMDSAQVELLAKAEAADAIRRGTGHFPVPTDQDVRFGFSDDPRNQPGQRSGRERK